jgi:Domain of unknown function (DUF4912)
MANENQSSESAVSARSGFRISEGPVVRHVSSELGLPPGLTELPRSYGAPLLFAIPRDPRTLFTYWNVDWSNLFSESEPMDRQVYLRIKAADGSDESEAAIEPMLGSYYAEVLQPGGEYQTELGYYDSGGNWSAIATSETVTMPPENVSENVELDLATVPFHLSFQRLIDLFRASNGNALSAILARLQARALTDAEREMFSPQEWEVFRAMDVSVDQMKAARDKFGQDHSALRKKAEAVLGFGATSPTSAFGGSSWGSGSS